MKPPLFLAMAVVFCARSARCQETKCLEPRSLLVHNRVQEAWDFETEFPVGSTLRYRCGPGYIKEGTDTWNATCVQKEDGSVDWDIDQYDCSPVSCGHPGDVHNGRLLNFDFHFPRNVRYDCNEGYELEGEPILYCRSDAKWNAPTPMCRRNSCSVEDFFKNAPHGLVILAAETHVRQNSTFRVSCDDGWILVGNGSTATCLQDGSWRLPSHVTCIEGCGNFDTGPGGPTVEGRKAVYALGDSITLSCKNGTELQPRIERIACLGDRWSENEVPICVPAKKDETNGVNNKGGKGA